MSACLSLSEARSQRPFGMYVSSEFEPWKRQWGANQTMSVKTASRLGVRLYKRDLSATPTAELLSHKRARACPGEAWGEGLIDRASYELAGRSALSGGGQREEEVLSRVRCFGIGSLPVEQMPEWSPITLFPRPSSLCHAVTHKTKVSVCHPGLRTQS